MKLLEAASREAEGDGGASLALLGELGAGSGLWFGAKPFSPGLVFAAWPAFASATSVPVSIPLMPRSSGSRVDYSSEATSAEVAPAAVAAVASTVQVAGAAQWVDEETEVTEAPLSVLLGTYC